MILPSQLVQIRPETIGEVQIDGAARAGLVLYCCCSRPGVGGGGPCELQEGRLNHQGRLPRSSFACSMAARSGSRGRPGRSGGVSREAETSARSRGPRLVSRGGGGGGVLGGERRRRFLATRRRKMVWSWGRGWGDGKRSTPLELDARRYFREARVSVFGARSIEFTSEARFPLRWSAGRSALFRISWAGWRHVSRPNKQPIVG
jgi:hypothetical protein